MGTVLSDRLGHNPVGQSRKQEKKGFSGHFLSGLDIPDLIQMCTRSHMTGVLKVNCETDSGDIYFKEGEIVHAVCGQLEGIEGFQRILSWKKGEINLKKGTLPPKESIHVPWDGLLLQTIAHLDDIEGDVSPESISQTKRSQASEIFRLHKLYSDALRWEEVQNCLICAVDTAEMIRPSAAPQKMQQWAKVFIEFALGTLDMSVWNKKARPFLISVTMGKKTWILDPHGSYLVALEVSRGADVKRLHHKVKLAMCESSEHF